ncbi:MAG: hypothetical protein H6816_02490 [Phycisphaerales bacterium]|nr:hypothetical protein [Phycisphaerales bacterium]
METVHDDKRLRSIYDAGQGYIYNDFEGDHRTKSSAESNKLHRAGCAQCDPRRDRNAMTTQTSGQKIFFATRKEAFDWLMEHRAGNYTRCVVCNA